ncbi:MAG: SH3 domain-containing protein, partial [Eubacteriales bacterium]|nr:SH3 domain-containing protein [Eubacteriales bacterium]
MRSHLLVYLNYANGKRHQLIRFAVMVMILAFVVSQAGLFATPETQVSAEDQFPRTGKISVSSSVNVRAFPTTTSSKVDALLNNHPVTVYEAVKGQLLTDYNTDIWYLITYSTSSGSKRTGYVLSSFVVLDPLVPITPDPVFEA